MKKQGLRVLMAGATAASMMMAVFSVNAAPVKFKQVVQVVNAKPGKANSGSFTKLQLADKYYSLTDDDGPLDGKTIRDDKKKGSDPAAPQQDDRVITITTEEIDDAETCECENPIVTSKFPKWPFFGLVGIPFLFIDGDKSPSPPVTATPSPMSPSPKEPPIPEPMTLLLFGTGLAGIGMAARRKFGKKEDSES